MQSITTYTYIPQFNIRFKGKVKLMIKVRRLKKMLTLGAKAVENIHFFRTRGFFLIYLSSQNRN
jgi:hypothetical protein